MTCLGRSKTAKGNRGLWCLLLTQFSTLEDKLSPSEEDQEESLKICAICCAVPCPVQGRVPCNHLIFSSFLCVFPPTSCMFPSIAIFKTSTNVYRRFCVIQQNTNPQKLQHWNVKLFILVDNNNRHPHQRGEVTGRESSPVVHTVPRVISHPCCFMCISTGVSEAHRMISQVINYLWGLYSVQSPKIRFVLRTTVIHCEEMSVILFATAD